MELFEQLLFLVFIFYDLLLQIDSAGFKAPTPIQAQTWPIALQNKDIVAIAKTGSGKTLGYLVPAFIHLRRRQNNRRNGPTVLVLAPTRELATQIKAEAIKFGGSSRVSCTVGRRSYFYFTITHSIVQSLLLLLVTTDSFFCFSACMVVLLNTLNLKN